MWLSLVKFALRDFRVNRITLPNVIVVIQLSRGCGRPSLRPAILQAHSDHSSIPFRSMVLGLRQLTRVGLFDDECVE
ncbi:hypothetical protein [Rubritalea tangerina]|uniref:hypothetical protein n=1 Tax=Rubritalea tangerina TaxID=430798 RepID=UPI00360E49E6